MWLSSYKIWNVFMTMEHPWNGPFQVIFGLQLPQMWLDFHEICTISSIPEEENSVWKSFLKSKIFTEIGRSQSLHFFSVFVQLCPLFLPRSRPKLKKLKAPTKLYHPAIRKLKNQGPILSQFFMKNTTIFCPILAVFC